MFNGITIDNFITLFILLNDFFIVLSKIQYIKSKNENGVLCIKDNDLTKIKELEEFILLVINSQFFFYIVIY